MPECPACGVERDSWQKLRLHHISEHGESLPNRECEQCGAAFFSEHERKYCSKDCRTEASTRSMAGADNPNYRGAKESTECERCGEAFEFYPSEKEGRFCAACVEGNDWQEPPSLSGENHPRYGGGKRTVTCDVCGAGIERYPSEIGDGATLCGEACRAAWLSEAFSGSGHPNWQGGGTGPYGQGWAAVRERALVRDGYSCVVCGATATELGRNPDVHHVVPVREFVEEPVLTERDAHTLDNVVCLCGPCHRRAEFGRYSPAELRWRAGVAACPAVESRLRP